MRKVDWRAKEVIRRAREGELNSQEWISIPAPFLVRWILSGRLDTQAH